MCTEKKNSCSFFSLIFGIFTSFILVFTFLSIFKKKEEEVVEVKEKFKKEKPNVRKIEKKKEVKEKPKVKKVLKKKEVKENNLNDRQNDILSMLKKEKEVKIENIMGEIVGVSERTLRRDMNKLEELGYSKKVGTTKACKYIFVK